jgi:transposase
MSTATPINLTDAEREQLQKRMSAATSQYRAVERARIILAADEGETNRTIAAAMGIRTGTVSKWRTRFARNRLAGLNDLPRSGVPLKYDKTTERRILAQLDEPPRAGYATWTGKSVAEALGDVSAHQVWRVLRRYTIHLQRRRSWCVSTDPQFAQKAADIVSLYLAPPGERCGAVC